MAKIVKKEQAKFKARGYRFSKKTQNLLNKLTKRTKKSQNDVARKALEGYEKYLDEDAAYMRGFMKNAIEGAEKALEGKNLKVIHEGSMHKVGAFDENIKDYVKANNVKPEPAGE